MQVIKSDDGKFNVALLISFFNRDVIFRETIFADVLDSSGNTKAVSIFSKYDYNPFCVI